jgi:hypothetical protein
MEENANRSKREKNPVLIGGTSFEPTILAARAGKNNC